MSILRNFGLAFRIARTNNRINGHGSLEAACASIRDCLNLLILEAIHGIYSRIEP